MEALPQSVVVMGDAIPALIDKVMLELVHMYLPSLVTDSVLILCDVHINSVLSCGSS